ncbi:hypothetical protein BaRGS_00021553 [Batillaria attramentaria]|uniref:LRAT domain-containing protein n=1 Tax=Batillaria attramentaria TaxID=370345 RepID=A0ABD0KJE0_9CAEN
MANRQHNERVLRNLQRGDIIRFGRLKGVYYHYGIYAGDDMVVHRYEAGPSIMDRLPLKSALTPSGVINNKAVIREDDFWKIVKAGVADIDNMFDEWTRPYPPDAVVSRARSKLGQKGYNLMTDNCEHFVTWCRYGFTTSEQVEVVKKELEKMLENNWMTKSEILSFLVLHYFTTKQDTGGSTREDQTEPPQLQEVNGESFENVTYTYSNEAPRNSAADNCFVFKTSRLISYYVRRVGAKLGLTKENPYPTAVPQNQDDALSEKGKEKQESAQDGNRKNLETMDVPSKKEDAKQYASKTYQSSPHTSQPEAALVETAEDEYCPLSDNPQNRKRLEQRGENKTAKPFEDGRKDRAVDKNELSAPLSKSNLASDQVACEAEDAFQERGAANAEKDCLKESKLQEQATPSDDLLRPKENRQSLAPDQNQSHSRVNGTTGMSWDREYFDSRESGTLPSIVDASRNNVEKSSNSTTSIRSNGTTGMSWHREHAEPREIPDILPSIVDTSVNANSIDSTSHNTRRVPVFQRYLSIDATSGRVAMVVKRVGYIEETAQNHGMSITNGSNTVAERLEQIGDHGGQHTGQGSSFSGHGNGTGGSSFSGQGYGTGGSSFSGQRNGTGGSSSSGQRNGTGGSSSSGQRNGTGGSSSSGQGNGTGGSSFSGQGYGTGGSSFSGQGYGTGGSSFSGQGYGTGGSSFSGQEYGQRPAVSFSGQGNGTAGSSSSGQGNGTEPAVLSVVREMAQAAVLSVVREMAQPAVLSSDLGI